MKRRFCVLGLLVFSLFRWSNSESLEIAFSARDSQPLAADPINLIATSPIALVVARDGTISCILVESGSLLWSYKSGVPTYSSMQASATVGDEEEFAMRDDTYIDVGADDGKLYIHDRRKGIKKRLDFGPKDLVSKTPLSANGTTILGQMTTTEIVVDAETGTVIRTLSPKGLESNGVNPSTLEKAIVRLKETGIPIPEAGELIIKRIDYAFSAYAEASGVPLWKLMFSDIKAEYSNRMDSSLFRSHCIPKLKEKMSSSCRAMIPVYQIHDAGYWKPPLIGTPDYKDENIDSKLAIPEPGYILAPRVNTKRVTILSSDESDSPVMVRGLPSSYAESISPVIAGAVGVPALDTDSVSKMVDINTSAIAWPIAVYACIFLLILGIIIYYVTHQRRRQNEDLKLKAIAPKKKKTRKSVLSKNRSPTVDSCEGASALLSHDKNVIPSGYGELRQVGKLYISFKEIAKGSNGTVVLEGFYDGRPVAVKRLVQTHYDVAQKEIQNLIASDQHPNVVRWYGMEYDSDFVYLALERCTCNLNDWILLCSQSSPNATSDRDMDPAWENKYALRLQLSIGNITNDFELWRANGYPSMQLLKLMRDVVSGLAHLHELGIIHRDLKPQNILIMKKKSYRAKLSDMGISKRLDVDMTALSQHATGIGSSGWRAPEQLKNGRQTRAVDLFSLGCVLFFCITGGRHPFGDRLERDSNIVNDHKDLFLVENIPEAFDLITRLLDPNPELRPKAIQVLQHPMFWNSDTRLCFLRDVSDRVELEDRENDSELLKALESVSPALGGKWDEKLEGSFLVNIARYRRYKYDSVRDLLRVVRNKLNHYRELPGDIQEVLGSVPEGFDCYFTSRFPRLLIEVYKVMYSYCRGEEFLSKYFRSTSLI